MSLRRRLAAWTLTEIGELLCDTSQPRTEPHQLGSHLQWLGAKLSIPETVTTDGLDNVPPDLRAEIIARRADMQDLARRLIELGESGGEGPVLEAEIYAALAEAERQQTDFDTFLASHGLYVNRRGQR